MGKNLKEKLDEVLVHQLDGLDSLEQGSEEHKTAVDSFAKLYEAKTNEENKEKEDEFKKKQSRNQNWNQWVALGVTAALGLGNLIFNAYFCERGFRFEEEGTYTSQTHKNLFPKFKR